MPLKHLEVGVLTDNFPISSGFNVLTMFENFKKGLSFKIQEACDYTKTLPTTVHHYASLFKPDNLPNKWVSLIC